MLNMTRSRIGASVFLVAVTGAVLVAVASATAQSGGLGAALTEAQVMGANPSNMVSTESFDDKTVLEDTTTGDQVIVDERDGYVISFVDAEVMNGMYAGNSKDSLLSEQALLDAARTFVEQTVPHWTSVADATVRIEPLYYDKTGQIAAYQASVKFREQYEGLPTSNSLDLTMDPATGKVASLRQGRATIDVDPVPEVSDAKAEAIALSEVGTPEASVRGGSTFVWTSPQTREAHLVRVVEVQARPAVTPEGMDSGIRAVMVDLHSGEVLAAIDY